MGKQEHHVMGIKLKCRTPCFSDNGSLRRVLKYVDSFVHVIQFFARSSEPLFLQLE